MEFKDGVDNFKPFLPKIKHKPHSLSPLNLKFSESGDYSHPYQEELNNFVPQMEDETILPVIRNFDIVPLIYVDEESKLSSLLADVGTCSVIGVDLEVLKLNIIMSNFQFYSTNEPLLNEIVLIQCIEKNIYRKTCIFVSFTNGPQFSFELYYSD